MKCGYYGIGVGIHLLSALPEGLIDHRLTNLTYHYGKGYNFGGGDYWGDNVVIEMKLNFPSVNDRGILQYINEKGEVKKRTEDIPIAEYCMAVSIAGGGFSDTSQSIQLLAYE